MTTNLYTAVSENFLSTPDIQYEVRCPIITENGGEAFGDEAIVISTNSLRVLHHILILLTWRNAATNSDQYATDLRDYAEQNILRWFE